MAENKYFSVLALFILFRETLEAAVIVSVLLQYMNRTKPAFKRPGGPRWTALWRACARRLAPPSTRFPRADAPSHPAPQCGSARCLAWA
jgi:hypothetical protein